MARFNKGPVSWKVSNVVLPLWITFYSVDTGYIICKERKSWKEGSLFKTVAQSKTQNKLISAVISYEICQCCHRIGWIESRGLYVFCWLFPPILAKYSVSFFHRPEHISCTLLMLLSCGPLRQNTLLHKMTGWWQILKKSGIHDPTNTIACASSLPFTMRNISTGFENSVFSHFREMFLLVEILKQRLFYVVAVMSSVFLQHAQWTSKRPRAAPGLTRSGGRLKGKSRILTVPLEK